MGGVNEARGMGRWRTVEECGADGQKVQQRCGVDLRTAFAGGLAQRAGSLYRLGRLRGNSALRSQLWLDGKIGVTRMQDMDDGTFRSAVPIIP